MRPLGPTTSSIASRKLGHFAGGKLESILTSVTPLSEYFGYDNGFLSTKNAIISVIGVDLHHIVGESVLANEVFLVSLGGSGVPSK